MWFRCFVQEVPPIYHVRTYVTECAHQSHKLLPGFTLIVAVPWIHGGGGMEPVAAVSPIFVVEGRGRAGTGAAE